MLAKSAVVKESVDQMELVYVTWDFTWRIVQVSLRYDILCLILFWPTVKKIVIKKIFCQFEAEGRKFNSQEQLIPTGKGHNYLWNRALLFSIIVIEYFGYKRQTSTYFSFTAASWNKK